MYVILPLTESLNYLTYTTMSQYRRKNKNCVIVDLADKHHVALTRFKRQSYFHLRHNSNGKTVSFNLADMQSLVDNFALMKRKLNKLSRAKMMMMMMMMNQRRRRSRNVPLTKRAVWSLKTTKKTMGQTSSLQPPFKISVFITCCQSSTSDVTDGSDKDICCCFTTTTTTTSDDV